MKTWHKCFPVNFTQFLRTHFLTEYVWRLTLYLLDEAIPETHLLNKLNCNFSYQNSIGIEATRRSGNGYKLYNKWRKIGYWYSKICNWKIYLTLWKIKESYFTIYLIFFISLHIKKIDFEILVTNFSSRNPGKYLI